MMLSCQWRRWRKSEDVIVVCFYKSYWELLWEKGGDYYREKADAFNVNNVLDS